MKLDVNGTETYCYTNNRTIDPGRESVVFIHGSGLDHTVWTLAARHFARHGRNVLAVDMPGHGRSSGEPLASVEAMADWYRILDLYVAPQRWEGFGLTPIEAMACGVPVIATRVGAFEQIVTPETGALVDPGDIPALSTAIRTALAPPRPIDQWTKDARPHVSEHFSIEREAAELVALYRRLLEG